MEILNPLGFIREEVRIVGTRKAKTFLALFDTGAYRNYIKRELSDGDSVNSIGLKIYEGEHYTVLADLSQIRGERIRFDEMVIRNSCEKDPMFIVMDDLYEDVIIGALSMQKLCIGLDPKTEKIIMCR